MRQVALEQDQVAWEVRILVNFDEVADLDLLTEPRHEEVVTQGAHIGITLVLFAVFFATFVIFEGVLDHGDSHHEHQGQQSKNPVHPRRGQPWDKLEDHDDQKVEVRHLFELLEQIERDKSRASVLGRRDVVLRVL